MKQHQQNRKQHRKPSFERKVKLTTTITSGINPNFLMQPNKREYKRRRIEVREKSDRKKNPRNS